MRYPSYHLEQWIALQTGLPRRRIHELFRDQKIWINGNPATQLTQALNPKVDVIHIDGQRLEPQKVNLVYYKFNKPSDVITTRTDPKERKCVGDYLKDLHPSVFTVGRLDRQTTGLLLLTNDGQWAHHIMHPSHSIVKVYALTLNMPITKTHLARLTAGIMLEDGPFRFTHVERQDKLRLLVSIEEGRNRIVRRAFEALGYTVKKLKRLAIGPIQLGTLPEGKIRPLSTAERISLDTYISSHASSETLNW